MEEGTKPPSRAGGKPAAPRCTSPCCGTLRTAAVPSSPQSPQCCCRPSALLPSLSFVYSVPMAAGPASETRGCFPKSAGFCSSAKGRAWGLVLPSNLTSFLSCSPGTWDKSHSVPPPTRQTTRPLLNSVTDATSAPRGYHFTVSGRGGNTDSDPPVHGNRKHYGPTAEAITLGIFLNTLGTVVISHMVLEMAGLCRM